MADKTSRLGIEGTAERKGGGLCVVEDDKRRHSFTGKHDLLRERRKREKGRWKKKSREVGTKKGEMRGGQTHSFMVDKTSC